MSISLSDKVSAWWCLGKPIWISLAVGYVWILGSVISSAKIAPSGAILVCACLISELVYSRMSWRKTAERYTDLIPIKRSGNYRVGSVILSDEQAIDLDLITAVSPNDCTWVAKDGRCLNLRVASDHADRILAWCIGVSAVIGTLIWGYIPSHW